MNEGSGKPATPSTPQRVRSFLWRNKAACVLSTEAVLFATMSVAEFVSLQPFDGVYFAGFTALVGTAAKSRISRSRSGATTNPDSMTPKDYWKARDCRQATKVLRRVTVACAAAALVTAFVGAVAVIGEGLNHHELGIKIVDGSYLPAIAAVGTAAAARRTQRNTKPSGPGL